MIPSFYKPRNCWRVQVPALESETGKRGSKYFKSKKDAERFIAEHRKTGSVQLAELSIHERHILGLIRQSEDYTPALLLEAWQSHQADQQSQLKSSLTVAELCKAFYDRQIQEKRSYRTISDDRWRLNKFVGTLGGLDSNRCTSVDISRYLEAIPPGTNRRSHYKTLRKLWRWAYRLGHVEVDPMTKIQPMDRWGVNAEHLSISVYNRLLRVVAGQEPPVKGQEPTTKYKFLLPYFVLAGMAGLRTCELVRSVPGDPVLNWEDILWTKNLILVRHTVAKQTRSRDHKRYVPLEQKAAEILKPLAGRGPVIGCCDNHLYIKRRQLARDMKIKLPENCLRNSYATYALTFRSLGDVAKAMGDAEATVKRYYIETLEPDIGHEWLHQTLTVLLVERSPIAPPSPDIMLRCVHAVRAPRFGCGRSSHHVRPQGASIPPSAKSSPKTVPRIDPAKSAPALRVAVTLPAIPPTLAKDDCDSSASGKKSGRLRRLRLDDSGAHRRYARRGRERIRGSNADLRLTCQIADAVLYCGNFEATHESLSLFKSISTDSMPSRSALIAVA